MSNINYFEFWEDEAKTSLIIRSLCKFKSSNSRNDEAREDSYRLLDGTLEFWNDFHKYEEELSLEEVLLAERDILEALHDSRQFFYYVPDPVNAPTVIFKVFWAGGYTEQFDKFNNVYSINIPLREA